MEILCDSSPKAFLFFHPFMSESRKKDRIENPKESQRAANAKGLMNDSLPASKFLEKKPQKKNKMHQEIGLGHIISLILYSYRQQLIVLRVILIYGHEASLFRIQIFRDKITKKLSNE